METKHIIALIVLTGFGAASLLVTLLYQWARDAALFFIMFCTTLMVRMDVNFLDENWYRGTSRGVEITLLDLVAWSLLITSLLFPRYRTARWYWPASLGFMMLYFVYCGVTVVNQSPQLFGLWELTKVFRGVLIFLTAAIAVRTRRELMIVVIALGCSVAVQAGYGFEQRVLKGLFRVPGTLSHENSLSMYLCTVSPVLLAGALSDWPKKVRMFCGILCPVAGFLVMMTLSRAGIPIFALVMGGTAFFCTTWRITKRKIYFGGASLVFGAVLVALLWQPLTSRFGQATFQEEYLDADGVETRGAYWRLVFAISKDRPGGVGLNNWSYWVSKKYGPQLGYMYNDYDEVAWDPDRDLRSVVNTAPPAHSLAVITWGELGLGGLALLSLVWLRWFQVGASFLRGRLNSDPMHRMGIGFLFGTVGIFLQSITEWTYRQSSILFTLHIMMGCLASLYYAKRRPVETVRPIEEEEDLPEIEFETPMAVSAVRVQR